MEKGWEVLAPLSAASPFDLVIYRKGKFLRVQVKYRKIVKGAVDVRVRRAVITQNSTKYRPNKEVDLICVYVANTSKLYYIPASVKVTNLRLSPARNCQRDGIVHASRFAEI